MFVPLRNYTQFTIHESILRLDRWMDWLKEHHIPAAAMTDQNNLFGLIQFYQAAIARKIKPIIAAHITCSPGPKQHPLNLLVYAQNAQGYQNLSNWISRYYQDNKSAGLDLRFCLEHHQDLIVVCAPESSEQLIQIGLDPWKKQFGDRLLFGVERYPDAHQTLKKSKEIIQLATQNHIPVVACNKVFFENPEDYHIQQIKYCIQKSLYLQDESRPIEHQKTYCLYPPHVMEELFSDCPAVLENTLALSRRCTVELILGQARLPQFAQDEKQTLKEQSEKGLAHRFQIGQCPVDQKERYDQRLAFEVEMINRMGFSGYFLIVADFIQWAKNHQIPVGPGRGSGAGSLVAYALSITDIDPLAYDLLFERFLNPERVSMPDFDVDFCMDRRDEVIEYVQKRYGSDRVSQIATFGTMAAKAVIRDVGRVLSHPFSFVDKIAKLIPNQVGISLQEALDQEPQLKDLYEQDEVIHELIDIALKLEGLPRNIGKHAGGVVISPCPLPEICPLYNEFDTPWHPVTQLDKDDVEKIGLVKFDFLGLKTLTIIDVAYQQARQLNLPITELAQLTVTDQACFKMLSQGETVGVFQVESRGFTELLKKVQPDCFEDIIALVALYRPGPLQSGMVDDFIDRKHGRAPIIYPHPLTESILKPTYGIILYQEQVMQLAQVVGGYSLGGADLLRRAMGKKKPEEMAKHRSIFVEGAAKKDVDPSISEPLFDLMEKFSGYGFNKSHAAVYALIVYQTAYLKVHAKAPFFASLLTAEQDHLEKISILIQECSAQKIQILPPCVNMSFSHSLALDPHSIRYGLCALKGLGAAVVDAIVQERLQNGPYSNLNSFVLRLRKTPMTRKHCEILIQVGAMDCFLHHRRALLEHDLPIAWDSFHDRIAQQSLFSDDIEDEASLQASHIPFQLWSQRIAAEKTLLGFAPSGSLFDPYLRIKNPPWTIKWSRDSDPVLAIWVKNRRMITQKGQPFTLIEFLFGSGGSKEFYWGGKGPQDLAEIAANFGDQKPIVIFWSKTESADKKERTVLKKIQSIEDYLAEQRLALEVTIQDSSDTRLPMFLKYCSAYEQHLSVKCMLYHGDQVVGANRYRLQHENHPELPALFSEIIEHAYALDSVSLSFQKIAQYH